MTQEIHKEAYKQAEKQIFDDKIKEVKEYILETHNRIEKKKREKAKIEEELRILKLDSEDLRNGRFEKLEERREKSRIAREVGVPIGTGYSIVTSTNGNGWATYTSGTYTLFNGDIIYF